jgi:hypothetical protein
MRGKRKFGLILLFVVFAVPAFGQGQPPDKTIIVFGQSIHYFDMGAGPVVVLLHGLGSRKEDWLPVFESMAQKYRLLVPDQIGFGRSDKPLLDYSVQTYVDFLNEFLRQLKVGKGELGRRVAGRVDRRALRSGDFRWSAHDTGGEAGACGCGRAEAGKARRGSESEFAGGDAWIDGGGILRHELVE